jgi:hypothetical protein
LNDGQLSHFGSRPSNRESSPRRSFK